MNLERTELENNIISYVFDGALDTLVEDQIRDLMNSDFENNKVRFVLDLSKVEFIMSTIVGFFISFQKKLKSEHGLLIVLKPSSEVNLVFKVLGLNLMFQFCDDLDSAIKKLNSIETEK
ncbi:MAG: STAS domain-containing protein [Candidatus Cloacimonetes bacterium]|nr:STAS domain-containing protein [Candidatus Cloacimonadota bacterium]